MCQVKPGLRCSTHARESLIKAQSLMQNLVENIRSLEDREDFSYEARELLLRAEKKIKEQQREWHMTPEGKAELELAIQTADAENDEVAAREYRTKLEQANNEAINRKTAVKLMQMDIEASRSNGLDFYEFDPNEPLNDIEKRDWAESYYKDDASIAMKNILREARNLTPEEFNSESGQRLVQANVLRHRISMARLERSKAYNESPKETV